MAFFIKMCYLKKWVFFWGEGFLKVSHQSLFWVERWYLMGILRRRDCRRANPCFQMFQNLCMWENNYKYQRYWFIILISHDFHHFFFYSMKFENKFLFSYLFWFQWYLNCVYSLNNEVCEKLRSSNVHNFTGMHANSGGNRPEWKWLSNIWKHSVVISLMLLSKIAFLLTYELA